jgi:hypothetical protein
MPFNYINYYIVYNFIVKYNDEMFKQWLYELN